MSTSVPSTANPGGAPSARRRRAAGRRRPRCRDGRERMTGPRSSMSNSIGAGGRRCPSVSQRWKWCSAADRTGSIDKTLASAGVPIGLSSVPRSRGQFEGRRSVPAPASRGRAPRPPSDGSGRCRAGEPGGYAVASVSTVEYEDRDVEVVAQAMRPGRHLRHGVGNLLGRRGGSPSRLIPHERTAVAEVDVEDEAVEGSCQWLHRVEVGRQPVGRLRRTERDDVTHGEPSSGSFGPSWSITSDGTAAACVKMSYAALSVGTDERAVALGVPDGETGRSAAGVAVDAIALRADTDEREPAVVDLGRSRRPRDRNRVTRCSRTTRPCR